MQFKRVSENFGINHHVMGVLLFFSIDAKFWSGLVWVWWRLICGCDLGRSETDVINVVERRIWHSMEEGQFENLPGKGKPLNLSTNPHADPAEDTLYRILSKNGCAPEWVELNKEIRNQISEWRSALKRAWESRFNGDSSKWVDTSEALKLQLRSINDKVREPLIIHIHLPVSSGSASQKLPWSLCCLSALLGIYEMLFGCLA